MLQARYSADEWKAWEKANESVREQQQAYDDAMIAGTVEPVYKFDHGVLHDEDVDMQAGQVTVRYPETLQPSSTAIAWPAAHGSGTAIANGPAVISFSCDEPSIARTRAVMARA